MKNAIFVLLRAWFCGSVAGGGPFLLLTVPIAAMSIGEVPVVSTLLIAFLPVLVAGAVTGPAIVLIGLPLTALLAHLGRERPGLYIAAGLGFGLLLPIGILFLMGDDGSGAWLSLFGAMAGAAAACVWGGWRQQVADGRADATGREDYYYPRA